MHGTLVEVVGLGVLLLGPSGIGKSECAIELVIRGFRFVADDAVQVTRGEDGRLIGEGPQMVRHHIELRGIGIVNVQNLYGATACADRATVDLVVELDRWGDVAPERLGLEHATYTLAGTAVPSVQIPVAPGRNVATLVEVAARSFAQRRAGLDAPRDLEERVKAILSEDPA